jgi:hypothetical protein
MEFVTVLCNRISDSVSDEMRQSMSDTERYRVQVCVP